VKKGIESKKSESSESIFSGLISATNDKPWLWAIYLLIVSIPVVLIVVLCCCKNSPANVSNKKTDEATKDDEPADEYEVPEPKESDDSDTVLVGSSSKNADADQDEKEHVSDCEEEKKPQAKQKPRKD